MIRRTLAAIIIVVTALALLVVAWPQLFGVARLPILAQLVSLRGAAASVGFGIVALLVISALVSTRVRRFAASMAAIMLVFCLVNLVVLSARGFGDTALPTAPIRM